jgi:polyhydroxyalkanoate synthesis regulator phasin
VKTEVREFVSEVLKPLYAKHKLSKDEYKWVAKKSVEHVLKNSKLDPGKPFMDPKRKKAIAALVEKYIKTRQQRSF